MMHLMLGRQLGLPATDIALTMPFTAGIGIGLITSMLAVLKQAGVTRTQCSRCCCNAAAIGLYTASCTMIGSIYRLHSVSAGMPLLVLSMLPDYTACRTSTAGKPQHRAGETLQS
jgi:hypothetical protein